MENVSICVRVCENGARLSFPLIRLREISKDCEQGSLERFRSFLNSSECLYDEARSDERNSFGEEYSYSPSPPFLFFWRFFFFLSSTRLLPSGFPGLFLSKKTSCSISDSWLHASTLPENERHSLHTPLHGKLGKKTALADDQLGLYFSHRGIQP